MAYNLSRLAILIAEDNQFVRQLLRGVLAGFGIRNINEAADGADALEALKNWTPDLVFADWEMAPMDGLELTKRIRLHENELLRFLPIVMVSSHTTMDRITTARDAGIT